MLELLYIASEESERKYTPIEFEALELALLQTDFYYHDLVVETKDAAGGPQVQLGLLRKRTNNARQIEHPSESSYAPIMLHLIQATESAVSTFTHVPFDPTIPGKPLTDLYNTYWLGTRFWQRNMVIPSSIMLEKVKSQLADASQKPHPHLLAWACFTACHSGGFPTHRGIIKDMKWELRDGAKKLSFSSPIDLDRLNRIFDYFSILTRTNLNPEDVVRMTIETFRRKLSRVNEQSLQLLSGLYHHLENVDDYDDGVAETMRLWTICSRQVAEQVHSNEGSS